MPPLPMLGANWLRNGDMEGDPEVWSVTRVNAFGEFGVDTDRVYEGRYSYQMTMFATINPGDYLSSRNETRYPAAPGETFVFAAWVSRNSVEVWPRVLMHFYRPDGTFIEGWVSGALPPPVSPPDAPVWQRIALQRVVPPETGYIRCELRLEGNRNAAMGYAWFDAMTLRKLWAAPVLTGQLVQTAVIDGIPTPALEIHTNHGTDQPIATATVLLPLPRPPHVKLGAELELQAGWVDGEIRTIFRGRIPDDASVFDDSGTTLTIRGVGWASLLNFPDYTDLVFPGPISLKELVRAVCVRRRIPVFLLDETTYPNGTTQIRFGGNPAIDEGKVIIPKRQAPLSVLNRVCKLFGYRLFDTPQGVRLQRVSGMPPNFERAAFIEASNILRVDGKRDLAPVVNYWDVRGAKYTAADGSEVAIRSIPAEVPNDPYLPPTGYRRQEISDQILTSQSLADAARNVAEIDSSRPYELVSWQSMGDPLATPGETVGVSSATIGADALVWVTKVQHDITDTTGFVTSWSGWRGAGSALPAGQDCITISLGAGPWHLGDEYLSWYARPTPLGEMVKLNFTVPDEYSTMTVRGRAHGTNSYFIDGSNADATVSKFEVWQFDKRVGSGDLPVLPEDYELRRPYSNDRWWSDLVIPIKGSLKPGAAELRILAGKDRRATGGEIDDFEVKSLSLTVCGVGEPILPGGA